MAEETKIFRVDQKYRIQFEQAASTKGTLGFKVEVNGDDITDVEIEANKLLAWAQSVAPANYGEAKVKE